MDQKKHNPLEFKSLLKYDEYLLTLTKLSSLDAGALNEAFNDITEATSKALNMDRVSIWLYNQERDAIVCQDLFELGTNQHSQGAILWAKDFPGYFKYLTEERTLAADDAHTDPATKEFSAVYLTPLNIFSMLDAPIRVNGKMIGVICSEKTHKPRHWTPVEQIFIGNIADVTARAVQAAERVNAQQQLELMNLNLAQLVDEKTRELELQRAKTAHASKMYFLGEMASSVAHEINNPLSIIACTCEQMRSILSEATLNLTDLNKSVDQVENTVLRISKIIKGLKSLSKNTLIDKKESRNLTEIVQDTVGFYQETLKRKNITVTVLSEPDIEIECCDSEVAQSLLNLLNNSMDAVAMLSEKWITLEIRKKGTQWVEILVTDSGQGIPEPQQSQIMNPFFSTKDCTKASGLGLNVSKDIIQAHGGTLNLNSESVNTQFIITLPLKTPRSQVA